MHEAKLDGWRFCAEVTDGRVRLWSRGGHDWAPKLPELESLGGLGDVVLDGEMIVATPDGRADFELLTTRLNRRPGDPTPAQPVSLYVFDVLRHQGQDLRDRPWSERRAILDQLELAEHTAGVARPSVLSSDGNAMHEATAAIGAEGTVSKAVRSVYRAGRSRYWLKAKHSRTETFQVAGWRPSTPSRPGGLIVAEDDQPIAVATLAIADRNGPLSSTCFTATAGNTPPAPSPSPIDCLTATVRYTSRTPTHGHLREAFVLAVQPAGLASAILFFFFFFFFFLGGGGGGGGGGAALSWAQFVSESWAHPALSAGWEAIARGSGIPVPGPVIGLVLCVVLLLARDKIGRRCRRNCVTGRSSRPGRASCRICRCCSSQRESGLSSGSTYLAANALAIVSALVVSTILTLVVTGWVFSVVARRAK